MEVTVAKSAGFCFGVKRAVDTVYREIESGEKPVYTFGPIIHKRDIGNAKRRLKLCKFIQLIQHNIFISILFQVNDDTHSLSVAFIADIRNFWQRTGMHTLCDF